MKKILALLAIFTTLVSSCKKDEEEPSPVTPPPAAESGSVTINFNNMVGDSTLVFNTQNYVNDNGDSFNVTVFKYYISNVILNKSNGDQIAESNSYHLVNAAVPSSCSFTVTGVPPGEYTSVSFTIGVDSARNVSGAQTGALDPANGMFWSWSSGYIMAKFEGTSPQSGASGNNLIFHTGGFSGPNSTIRRTTPAFPAGETLTVTNNSTSTVTYKADLLEWFKTPNAINFATHHTIHMPGVDAKNVAVNYTDMLSTQTIAD